MKSLNELIDTVGDADHPELENPYLGVRDQEVYQLGLKRGHRACFDLLAPALKEAVGALEDMEKNMDSCNSWAELALDRVRKIIEGHSK